MPCGGGKMLRVTENIQFFYDQYGVVRLLSTIACSVLSFW
jgi:hypothetical protein